MTFDAIIKNGMLVTLNEVMPVIASGWVGIEKGCIRAVEAGKPTANAGNIIDAAGGIVMPGLVNTHTHLPMTLFRGLADDLPLETWLNQHIFPAEANHIRPKTVRWGTLLACAEMLLSGTTCCCDGYFHEEAVAKAMAQTGMRAVLGQGVIDFPAPGVPDPTQNVAHAESYAETWLTRYPLIRPSIFCHAPYTCGEATLTSAKAAADRLGVLFQVHAAETRFERDQSLKEKGASPVAYLNRLGLLDENTLLAHCVWLDPADMDILAASHCGVSHCPESNMKLASGIAPVPNLLARKVCVALGTDGCASNNDLNLFGEMGMAAKLHKAATGDPTVVDAMAVLKMATLDGARAIGLGDRIGSLEVGKRADIVVLDTDVPHLTPLYHPESHLVYATSGADVRDVMVDGRLLVKDRRLLTIDIDAVMGQVNRIARNIQHDNVG